MAIDAKTLETITAGIKKRRLGAEIHFGSQTPRVYRIPYKSPGMNYATQGGFPIGRFGTSWGKGSTFKSRSAYELMAQAQHLPQAAEEALWPRIKVYRELGEDRRVRLLEDELEYIKDHWPDGMEIALYNAELQWDKVWAKKLGIDTDRVLIVESLVIEEICEIMQNSFAGIDMHVVDSTSNAGSLATHKADYGEHGGYGPEARAWKRSLMKCMVSFDYGRNVGVLINQASTNMKTSGAQPVSTQFISHTSSLTLKFETAYQLYSQNGVLEQGKKTGDDDASLAGRREADGIDIMMTVDKSRVCRPMRVAHLYARYGAKTFDFVRELVDMAIFHEIIVKKTTWYSIVNKETGEFENLGQGLKAVYNRLVEDVDLRGFVYATQMMTLDSEDDFEVEDIEAYRDRLASDGEEEAPKEEAA